ncbi:MAG: hypothetical protein AAF098_12715 [Pseudomonadota bacterium]
MSDLNTRPFLLEQALSTVTAMLPRNKAPTVIEAITKEAESSAFVWDARGTLLHEAWYKQLLPSISPGKSMIQLMLPDNEVDRLMNVIVNAGKLHLQSSGAVFCTPCDDVYLGADFRRWPMADRDRIKDASHDLQENLDVIFYIVEPDRTDAIARAAIRAGSHGPIVYFGEGKGLRDRLGWLRITKQPLKEIVTVITDSSNGDAVFAAMAKAGQVHLPGRGFMYRIPVEKGMFNLPSIVAQHQYAANMQQIINAIDQLNGHTHWRDQEVFSVGGEGKGAGLEFLDRVNQPVEQRQVCQQAIVQRAYAEQMTDMFLEAGIAGINVSHVRHEIGADQSQFHNAGLNVEYSLLRCVVGEEDAKVLGAKVAESAASAGLQDVCLFRQPVVDTATYVPGANEYRKNDAA